MKGNHFIFRMIIFFLLLQQRIGLNNITSYYRNYCAQFLTRELSHLKNVYRHYYVFVQKFFDIKVFDENNDEFRKNSGTKNMFSSANDSYSSRNIKSCIYGIFRNKERRNSIIRTLIKTQVKK